MASVASQLLDEVTARAQSDSLEDAREICADGTYFTNNLRIYIYIYICIYIKFKKSKIYIKTFKTLLHVSITRSSSGSIYCSLLKL